MRVAHVPDDEGDRLEALRRYRLLDTPPEAAFDEITAAASEIASTPVALISLIDGDRQWFKSRRGLDVSETPREIAFCAHTILGDEPMVVTDAAVDPRFDDNPLVTPAAGIRFYAGIPLKSDSGHKLGTLCVIDTEPRTIDDGLLTELCSLAARTEQLMLERHLAFEEPDNSAYLSLIDQPLREAIEAVHHAHRQLAGTDLSREQADHLAAGSYALGQLSHLVGCVRPKAAAPVS
ncbi:MAG: GAF domain-containing protein [Actinomycetota bacterium]